MKLFNKILKLRAPFSDIQFRRVHEVPILPNRKKYIISLEIRLYLKSTVK